MAGPPIQARSLRRGAGGRRGASARADGSPFGAGHYDDLDRAAGRRGAGQPGLRQPDRRRRLPPGDTVLDLGSGGGIDVLLSARRVGPTGFVYGLDATVEMVELARRNAAEAGVGNVEFLHGTIEHDPARGRLGRRRHLELRHRAGRATRTPRSPRSPASCGLVAASGSATSSATARPTATEPAVDCAAGAITVDDYDAALRRAGLTDVSVEPTDPLGGGLTNAIIHAINGSVAGPRW